LTSPKDFGGLIRGYRCRKGLTLSQLASEVGISEAHLSRIENGGSTASLTIAAIADALEVSKYGLLDAAGRLSGVPEEYADFVRMLIDDLGFFMHHLYRWRGRFSSLHSAMPYEVLESTARETLMSFYRDRESTVRLPIPVDRIANGIGFRVNERHDSNRLERGWVVGITKDIFVNTAECKTQEMMRFTIAHEIGHIVMHSFSVLEVVKSKSRQIFELEANRFAGALLIPEDVVKAVCMEVFNCYGYGLHDSRFRDALSRKFLVSVTVMDRRLAELGLIDRSIGKGARKRSDKGHRQYNRYINALNDVCCSLGVGK